MSKPLSKLQAAMKAKLQVGVRLYVFGVLACELKVTFVGCALHC